MQIKLIDVEPRPVWFEAGLRNCVNYYRAELPARMTGGVSGGAIEVSADGQGFAPLDVSRREDLKRVLTASEVTIRGLGTCNVFLHGNLFDYSPELPQFVAALESAGATVAIDWDDNITSPEWARETIAAVREEEFRRFKRTFPGWGRFEHDIHWNNSQRARAEGELARRWREQIFRASKRHIVATPDLRTVVLSQNPSADVRLAPNAIDPRDYGRQKARCGPVRIGVTGNAIPHRRDVEALAITAMRQCSCRYGAELHFWGRGWDGIAAEHMLHPSLPTREFHNDIALLDVALLPLIDDDMNRARSAQRWFEHSVHGTACVVSDLPPYACVEHGVTGFKARTEAEFTRYSLMLCKDAALRKRIGEAAREAVMARHTVTACAEQWRAAVAA